jgi:hypothetical protein
VQTYEIKGRSEATRLNVGGALRENRWMSRERYHKTVVILALIAFVLYIVLLYARMQ